MKKSGLSLTTKGFFSELLQTTIQALVFWGVIVFVLWAFSISFGFTFWMALSVVIVKKLYLVNNSKF